MSEMSLLAETSERCTFETKIVWVNECEMCGNNSVSH
jgi:hypothetical protein